jgi:phosphatidylglycerophosphate synthase
VRRWLPTIISLSRVPLALLLVVVYRPQTNQIALVVVIYALAACTDKLDGILARHLNVASYAGYLVDGFADRCISIACILTAVFYHHLPLWIACIAVGREFLLSTCRLLDPAWYPPSRRERRHSLIVFGTSRIWFLLLLASAFLQSAGMAELSVLWWIPTGVYSIVVIVSFGLLAVLLTRQVGECIRREH